MRKILHVSCSPRGQASESHRLAQKIIRLLLQRDPSALLVDRVIGGGAISHIDEDYAISQSSSADVSQEGTMAHSEELIQELERSDYVVIGTPMHNFTVPSVLKAWIDHIVRARRTFNITPAGEGRHAARPSGLCRHILGWKIFRGAGPSTGFPHAVSNDHPRHDRTA